MTVKCSTDDDRGYRYKDLGSADQHRTEPHFKEFFRLVKEEGLLAKEPHIVRTKAFCGFDLDHKLI